MYVNIYLDLAVLVLHGSHTRLNIPNLGGPHNTCLFPRDKNEEWPGLTKFRVLFPHLAHAMKVFGRLVEKTLPLPVSVAKNVLPTWAIIKVPEVPDFIHRLRHMQTRICTRRPAYAHAKNTNCLNKMSKKRSRSYRVAGDSELYKRLPKKCKQRWKKEKREREGAGSKTWSCASRCTNLTNNLTDGKQIL